LKFHPDPFQSLLLSVHLQCKLEAGYPYIFPNSKLVLAKPQFRDDPANSLVLHLPMCVTRTSDSSLKLERMTDARLSCSRNCGKRWRDVHCTSASKSLVSTIHSSLHGTSTHEFHVLLQMQLL